ncbi:MULTISPECIES: BrnT family toxin [unclassified Polynucleobacter]|uniref:BrnT family toxin n=1 Tax=unclassified Polynucleobacter TaxID=2640945 RepID=UPI0025FA3B22|nr:MULTISPECIES: BrnT family toxin [unclassified Polynucleobacter]
MNKLLLQLNELIEFDSQKRFQTLLERGLDFARAGEIFSGTIHTSPDLRQSYGESRFITLGFLDGRLTVVVWTPRGSRKRIISMRNANERENKEYSQGMDRP